MMVGNKYGARKITDPATGYVFDSRKEFMRWCELRLMERSGLIQSLRRQVKFELIPKQDGERACYYIADFVYCDQSGNTIVEDCKGFSTDAFKIKRKLFQWRYNMKIKIT